MKEISDLIGPPRWYHFIVCLLTFVRAFPSSWTQLTALFVAADVEHWCSRPNDTAFANWTDERWKAEAIPIVNGSGFATVPKYESCRMFPVEAVGDDVSSVHFDQSRTVSCDTWSYNETVPGSSAVPEWDLVCQHEWQRSMMTSVVFVGSVVGSLVMGHMSDRFGRRTVFFVSVFGVAFFGSLGAVSPSVKWYNALRFFASVNIAGIQTSSAALLAEILDPRFRTLLNLGYTAGFAIPSMLLPGVAYLLSDWKLLQLVSGLVAVACLPFMLFCDNFLMFAFTLGAVDIEGSHLTNFAVSTAAEMPAAFVGLAVVYYCRRRWSQVVALLLAGVAATALELAPTGHPYVSLSMSMVGRFVLIVSASVKWVWTMELFPTAARGFGFAACFTVGRFGGIVAPFMSVIKKQAPVYVAAGLLATAAVTGAGAAALLPETRGIELPDTFDEAEDVAKERPRAEDSEVATKETAKGGGGEQEDDVCFSRM
ncbi:hypothetical protein HPB50_003944 [Hyalomma asiaticum]|uniref:Uncharacterized protein n=1 Tax=Hyalomma asiaticum TaxID=266040 RepID=A0ACB7RJ77_HYAAI|nr:hypothetical protein HPB50_003944 [Hyalomma asiaticum]